MDCCYDITMQRDSQTKERKWYELHCSIKELTTSIGKYWHAYTFSDSKAIRVFGRSSLNGSILLAPRVAAMQSTFPTLEDRPDSCMGSHRFSFPVQWSLTVDQYGQRGEPHLEHDSSAIVPQEMARGHQQGLLPQTRFIYTDIREESCIKNAAVSLFEAASSVCDATPLHDRWDICRPNACSRFVSSLRLTANSAAVVCGPAFALGRLMPRLCRAYAGEPILPRRSRSNQLCGRHQARFSTTLLDRFCCYIVVSGIKLAP